jgi:plasmid stabilization system protein ParE
VGVPGDHDDVAALLAKRPPGWEYLLFAAVLRRGFDSLATKHRDHTLRYATHGREFLDDEQALQFILGSSVRLHAIVDSFQRMLTTDAQDAAFGRPGEPGDPDLIVHLGQRLVDLYEELLDWAATLRAAAAWSQALRRLADVTARLADQPIASLRSSVAEFVDLIDSMPARLRDGERVAIDLVVRLDLPEEIITEHAAALSAYEAGAGA